MTAPLPAVDWASFADALLSFVATWFLQATILLGLCALFARVLSRGSARVEEGLWKTAIVASLLATCLVLGTGWKPLGGRISLTSSTRVSPPEAPLHAGLSELRLIPTRLPGASLALVEDRTSLPSHAASPLRANWKTWITGALVAGALLGLLRLFFDQRAFARRIAHRRTLRTDEFGRPGQLAEIHQELLEENELQGRVTLSASARLQSPISFGLRKREVCVPVRAIGDLEPEEQRAMLAHEVAHAARRDPAWNTGLRLLRAIFWFHPLLAVAEHRLHLLFELRCDKRAAQLVNDPLALASCLTEVAAWIVPPIPRSVGAAGMATRASSLGLRVDELLALSPQDLRTPETPTWRSARYSVPALLLVAFASASPAVERAPDTPERSPHDFSPATFVLSEEEMISEAVTSQHTAIAPLLIELDADLAALNLEFEDLRRLASSQSNPSIDALLEDWSHRLQFLETARQRLEAALLEAAMPSPKRKLAHGSQAAHGLPKPEFRGSPRIENTQR